MLAGPRWLLHEHVNDLLGNLDRREDFVVGEEAVDVLGRRVVDGVLHGLGPRLRVLVFGLLLSAGVEVEQALVKVDLAKVELAGGEGLAELVLLGGDVEGLLGLGGPGELGDLVRAEAGDGAAVGGDGLGADDDHADLLHDEGDGAEGDGGDADALGAQGGHHAVALDLEGRVDGVDDAEAPGVVDVVAKVVPLGGAAQQRADDAAAAQREHRGAVGDVLAGVDGDALAAVLGAGGEEAAVAQQVLARLLEPDVGVRVVLLLLVVARAGRIRLLKRHEQVLLEQVGAVGQGDGVGLGRLQLGALRLDEIDSLVDGLDFAVAQELDQGLDGRHGHREVGVLGEEAAVGRYDVESFSIRIAGAAKRQIALGRTSRCGAGRASVTVLCHDSTQYAWGATQSMYISGVRSLGTRP